MRAILSTSLFLLVTAALSAQTAAVPGGFSGAFSGETRGQAEIALQGYYLGGSSSLNTTSGVALHFNNFLPGIGLLSGSIESYGADGRFRLGENSITLGGVVWHGQRWSLTGGDFHLLPSTIEMPFTNIVNPDLSGRGVRIQSTTKNRTLTLFWGQATLLEGPRIPFRISAGQQMMGLTLQEKIGSRLTIGARAIRLTTAATALDPENPDSALFPTNRQFRVANVAAVQSLFTLTKDLKFFGEAGASFMGGAMGLDQSTGISNEVSAGHQPLALTAGVSYDTPRVTVRANYVSQGAAYLPVAGQFAGDRRGPFGEIRYRPIKQVELSASASDYRNNLEERSDVSTFHSSGYSAGLSVALPWKFNASSQLSTLSYDSLLNDVRQYSDNRELSLTLTRSFGRHGLRVTLRDLDLKTSDPQRQRSAEIEDQVNWKRFSFGGAIRQQDLVTNQNRQTLFFRGSAQVHLRRFSAFAQAEFGNDLVNQTVFSTSSFSTTVIGLNAPVIHGWALQLEAFRNHLNTAVNPQNIFLLGNQGSGLSTALSGFSENGFDQWSVFIRLTHSLHWGGRLPAGGDLDAFTRSQIPITGSVEGLISEMTENGPRRVEGIPVTLDNSRTVLSDSEGHYRIPDVPEGVHRLGLAATELPAEFNPGDNPIASVVVNARKLTRSDFQVVRLGEILGHVDAPPKSGIEDDVENVVIRLEPGGRYTTPDFDGNFAFYNLPEGVYKVNIDGNTTPQFAVMKTKTEYNIEVKAAESARKVVFGYTIIVPEKPIRQIALPENNNNRTNIPPDRNF